jgi:hypothetical protein
MKFMAIMAAAFISSASAIRNLLTKIFFFAIFILTMMVQNIVGIMGVDGPRRAALEGNAGE